MGRDDDFVDGDGAFANGNGAVGRPSSAWFARTVPARWTWLQLAFAALLTVLGAFDTDRLGWGLRAAYWSACVLGGGLIIRRVERVFRRAAAPLRLPATALLAGAPIAVWVLLVGAATGASAHPIRLLWLYPSSVLLAGLLLALDGLLGSVATQPPQATPPAPTSAPRVIARKLSPRLARARLQAVEAQDHYLRIVTDAGEALIHMRMSDALAALSDRRGLQVHRSWWVALDAIDEATWAKGRGRLRLCSGQEAPVSRTHAEALKAALAGQAA